MNKKKIPDLSMTKVEELLKQCWNYKQKEYTDSILSAKELEEYVSWMLTDYVPEHGISLSSSELPGFLTHNSHAALAGQLINSPEDTNAQSAISVNRMLRFMPPQWHKGDFYKVYYTLSGVCKVHIEDEVIEVSPGTVVIVAPDVLCATPCFSESCVLLTFMLQQDTFDRVFWSQLSGDNLLSDIFRRALSLKTGAAYLHFETDADLELYYLLCQIYTEYFRPKAYGAQLLNALMSEFFTMLLERYEGSAQLPRTKDFFWKPEFSAVLSYIQRNYAATTIDEVAEIFHYSRRQIGRIVKNYTGQTYADLTYKLRMEKAGSLLHLGTLHLEEIAAAAGYSTLSSFYRAFTNYYSCTPGEYKQKSCNIM